MIIFADFEFLKKGGSAFGCQGVPTVVLAMHPILEKINYISLSEPFGFGERGEAPSICRLQWHITTLQQKFDTFKVTFCRSQMKWGATIKITDIHIVAHEHMPVKAKRF